MNPWLGHICVSSEIPTHERVRFRFNADSRSDRIIGRRFIRSSHVQYPVVRAHASVVSSLVPTEIPAVDILRGVRIGVAFGGTFLAFE